MFLIICSAFLLLQAKVRKENGDMVTPIAVFLTKITDLRIFPPSPQKRA